MRKDTTKDNNQNKAKCCKQNLFENDVITTKGSTHPAIRFILLQKLI